MALRTVMRLTPVQVAQLGLRGNAGTHVVHVVHDRLAQVVCDLLVQRRRGITRQFSGHLHPYSGDKRLSSVKYVLLPYIPYQVKGAVDLAIDRAQGNDTGFAKIMPKRP